MFYEFSDPDKHALTQTMLQSSEKVNRLRWMIKAPQLQVGQGEQASNLIKEVSDKAKSAAQNNKPVERMYTTCTLWKVSCWAKAFNTQHLPHKPELSGLLTSIFRIPTNMLLLKSYPSERTAAQNDEVFREETCTLWKVSCSAKAFNRTFATGQSCRPAHQHLSVNMGSDKHVLTQTMWKSSGQFRWMGSAAPRRSGASQQPDQGDE
eukprot:s9976_g1.t1